MVAYAVLSLTMIRMLPVAVSLIGLGLRPATVGFFVVMTVTVLLSVFAHGITAAPFSRRLALAGPDEPVVELPTRWRTAAR